MIILLFILVALLIFAVITGLAGGITQDKELVKTSAILFGMAAICFLLNIFITSPKYFKASKYKHLIEVRSEMINGVEVRTDTVFIFTRKIK